MALRDIYAKGLEAKGAIKQEGKSRKYWIYKLGDYFYFLGPAGGVRIGETLRVYASRSAGEQVKYNLRKAAEKAAK